MCVCVFAVNVMNDERYTSVVTFVTADFTNSFKCNLTASHFTSRPNTVFEISVLFRI